MNDDGDTEFGRAIGVAIVIEKVAPDERRPHAR